MIRHGINMHLNMHVGGNEVIPIVVPSSPTPFIHDDFEYSASLNSAASSPIAGPSTWRLGAVAGTPDFDASGTYASVTNISGPTSAAQTVTPTNAGTGAYTVVTPWKMGSVANGGFGPFLRVIDQGATIDGIWCRVKTTATTNVSIGTYLNASFTERASTPYTIPTAGTEISLTAVNGTLVTLDSDDGTTQKSISWDSTGYTSLDTATRVGILEAQTVADNMRCLDFKMYV